MFELLISCSGSNFNGISREQLREAFVGTLPGFASEIDSLVELVRQKTLGIPSIVKDLFSRIDREFSEIAFTDAAAITKLRTLLESIDYAQELDQIITEHYSALAFNEKRLVFFIMLLSYQSSNISIEKLLEIFPRYKAEMGEMLEHLQAGGWIKIADSSQTIMADLLYLRSKVVDIRMNLIEEMEKTRGSIEHVLSQIPVGLALFNSDGTLEFMNNAHTGIMEKLPVAGEVNWWAKHLHPEDLHIFPKALQNILKNSFASTGYGSFYWYEWRNYLCLSPHDVGILYWKNNWDTG